MIRRRARVRFAPVPSDRLDVGSARTALFNWLYARRTGGTMILRIADTARESYQPIVDALEWLGIDWDEGPGRGGARGPYRQSARPVVYHTEAERLLARGDAYRCFCTPDEIDELHREALAAGAPPVYDGRCRRLPDDEVAHRLAHGVEHVVRFRATPARAPRRADAPDDVVLIDADGRPSRVFAEVVDDVAMGITHVIRGEERAADAPVQALLFRALGRRPPVLVHLPVVREGDGAMTSVQALRERGYSPDGVVNALALLGWSDGSAREVFARRELVEAFSLEGVSRGPVAFDEAVLRRIDAAHFNRLDPIKRLAAVTVRLVDEGVLPADFHAEEWRAPDGPRGANGKNGNGDERLARFKGEMPRLGFILNVMGDRLGGARDAGSCLRFFFKDDYPVAARDWDHPGAPATIERVADVLATVEPFVHTALEAALRALADELGVSLDELAHPCRVAITGRDDSPDIFAVIQLVGRAKCVERLRAAAARSATA